MALTRDFSKFLRFSALTDFVEIQNRGTVKKFPFSTSCQVLGKHFDPKFKWHRMKKVLPVVLPHTKEAERQKIEAITNLGIYPRYWKPRPLTIMSSKEIIDPYQPVVGDGKVSKLDGAKSMVTDTKSKVSDLIAMRRIKNFDSNFNTEVFLQEVQDIYIKAHTTLMTGSAEKLSQYVTENANEQMRNGLKNCTLRWKFIESLEPPKIVQARTMEIVTSTNLFAQVTVRFHSKQTLAIYDRFGRLTYGSEILAKDVLEYVVFEKHINNENGEWRLHGKIIPEWREKNAQPPRTYRINAQEEEEEEDELEELKESFLESHFPERTESTEAAQAGSASNK